MDGPAVMPGRNPITERTLRPLVAELNWTIQFVVWRRLHLENR